MRVNCRSAQLDQEEGKAEAQGIQKMNEALQDIDAMPYEQRMARKFYNWQEFMLNW